MSIAIAVSSAGQQCAEIMVTYLNYQATFNERMLQWLQSMTCTEANQPKLVMRRSSNFFNAVLMYLVLILKNSAQNA